MMCYSTEWVVCSGMYTGTSLLVNVNQACDLVISANKPLLLKRCSLKQASVHPYLFRPVTPQVVTAFVYSIDWHSGS